MICSFTKLIILIKPLVLQRWYIISVVDGTRRQDRPQSGLHIYLCRVVDEHSQPTGTRAASTVLTAAILQTDLEEVPLMSEKQFQAEKLYYISILHCEIDA